MSLTGKFSRYFTSSIRSRGQDYFRSRLVKITKADHKKLEAKVSGSDNYKVVFEVKGKDLVVSCTCPYFDEDYCKHIWATMLAAEAQGYLYEASKTVSQLVMDDVDDDEDDEEEDTYETKRARVERVLQRFQSGQMQPLKKSAAIAPPKPQPPTAWKKQLDSLSQTLERSNVQGRDDWKAGREILYAIDVPETLNKQGLLIEILYRDLKKDGEWGRLQRLNLSKEVIQKITDPGDKRIVALLVGAQTQDYYGYSYYGSSSRFKVEHPLEQILLPMICGTGRCRLKLEQPLMPQQVPVLEEEPLQWDDSGVWEFLVEGKREGENYLLTGSLKRGDEQISVTEPALFVAGGLVFFRDRVARFDDGGAFAWVLLFRKEGALTVHASQRDELLEKILSMPKLPRMELPEELQVENVTVTPQPIIKFKKQPKSGYYYRNDDKLIATVSFDYDGTIVEQKKAQRGVFQAEQRRFLLRDEEFEQAAINRLEQLGLRSSYSYYSGQTTELSAKKLPKVVKALVAEGWRVEAEGKLYRQPGEFKIQVSSGIDWFDVSGAMDFGGVSAKLPTLLAALKRGENTVLLDDGTFGLLPEEWLKKYEMLAGLGETDGTEVRFRRSQAGLLDALLATQPEASFDEGFLRAREELRTFEGIKPLDPPETFVGVLREYQREGLGWLHFLQKFGFGGCLADDMGLGKCLSADSLIAINGQLSAAEEIWKLYASAETFDGEGYWSEPSEKLLVNSIDERAGNIVQSEIRRLYRQSIREPLRLIRLEDGSQIKITRRHKLLTNRGWTNELRVEDFVCVPKKMIWAGKREDPDLMKFLAWQIAEGYERCDGNRLCITQKDTGILRELRETLYRISDRYAIKVNHPAINIWKEKTPDLRIYSVAYRAFLEAKGYTWGNLSRAKSIPSFVMQADAPSIRIFLSNFFEAEGSVCEGMQSIEINTASPLLIQQLSHLLRRFGIWLRISAKQKRATNGTGIFRTYYCGVMGGNAARRFCQEIGFAGAEKQRRLEKVCERTNNINVEGIPASEIVAGVVKTTQFPSRHLNIPEVYLRGPQQFSAASLEGVVSAMEDITNGETERHYRSLKKSKWTEKPLAAYSALDKESLSATQEHLQHLLEQEVFYCKIKAIEEIEYDGWVYDFEVSEHHNFVANNILCHNTIEVLSLLDSRREQRESLEKTALKNGKKSSDNGLDKKLAPSLVVVPKSLVFNWKAEAARFTPKLRILDHTGGFRRKSTEHFDDYDLVITTYGTLRNDVIQLKDFQFDYVILDESQAVKNAATEQAKAVRLLRGDYRLALSGTPIENHLGELWSLFEFLNPGLLGSASVFKLGGAGGKNVDEATRELLAKGLRPFILRRTKSQVAKDLPEKLEQTIYCELDTKQRKLYDELRAHYRQSLLGLVDKVGLQKSKIQVLEALLRLRQAACHPGLIDKNRVIEPSAKLDLLIEQLTELHDEGHKTLVFSQFTSFLAIVKNRLDKEGITYEYLDGRTRNRAERVERFQTDPDCKLFLISLKAGGLGLNLTAAEYVFLLDPWWNPAVEAQAIDRAHRIGQTQRVFAYRLIARDTVEEKVLQLQNTKRELADAIINADNSLIRSLGRDDLELLLS